MKCGASIKQKWNHTAKAFRTLQKNISTNTNSGERMLVKESEIEKFVNLGWIKGKGK